MKTALLKKVPGALIALGLYYVLPLAARPSLLITVSILIPMIVCALVFLTQPPTNAGQVTEKSDRNSMIYLMIGTIISQQAVILEWAYWEQNHAFRWSSATVFGLLLMVIGLTVRLWAIQELGRFFTNEIRIRNDHQLIQTGPYKLIRHPSYLGVFLIATGIGIFLSAWVGVLITGVVLSSVYLYRIRQEEKALEQRLGHSYRVYRQKTKKLIPYIL